MACSDQRKPAENIVWHDGAVSREQRRRLTGQGGGTVWLTGLSGSGKSTIAVELERALTAQGRFVYRLDGDNLRMGINAGLGFSAEDRAENVRRAGEVARLFADAGLIAIICLISPFRAQRDAARAAHAASDVPFIEVFVDAPLEVAEARDPKGLYRKARAGEIRGFTGIDDPYEAPRAAELHLRTDQADPAVCTEAVIGAMRERGMLECG